MATRTLRFFMTPDELLPACRELTERLGLSIILWQLRPEARLELAREPLDLRMRDGTLPHAFYFSAERPEVGALDPRHLEPGAWGWVQLDGPEVVGNVLLMAVLAAKSDWWDARRRRVLENPEALALFARVARVFRRSLLRPMWASSLRPGSSGPELVNDVGYTPGARDWARGGGALMQRGVAYVRYWPHEPGPTQRQRSGDEMPTSSTRSLA